jgi:hypothetical protein
MYDVFKVNNSVEIRGEHEELFGLADETIDAIYDHRYHDPSIGLFADHIHTTDPVGVGNLAFSMHIMDSSAKAETLKKAFISAIDQGYDPNDQEIKDYIYEQTGIYPDQLTQVDREKLQDYVGQYYVTYGY